MNANKCSYDIRIAGQPFSKLGQENTNAREDLYTHSLRQLFILYHLVHYRLDRPLQEEKYWPECLKLLREDLDSSLCVQKISESWLKTFLPERKSAQKRATHELDTSSLQPLLAAAREEIEKVLKNLQEIASQADKFWSPYQKRRYIKSELNTLSRWALRRSWEVYKVLNLCVSRPVVDRPRQEAGSRNNGSRKAAQCAAL